MVKWWIIVKKQEMSKLWVDGKFVPVTLFSVPEQQVVRWKTEKNDWYTAVVVWVERKEINKDKWNKISYTTVVEFLFNAVDDSWSPNVDQLENIDSVTIVGCSKWKGFQWVMKRHNFAWGPASHGSKFHRAAGSTGNRKPRRTIRGQKMAGRMGGDRVTLKKVPVVDVWSNGWETMVALKGSVPGAYNSLLTLSIV